MLFSSRVTGVQLGLRLGLDLVSGWLVVLHTYLFYFLSSLYRTLLFYGINAVLLLYIIACYFILLTLRMCVLPSLVNKHIRKAHSTDGAMDNSLHHRWTVFPVSSCIHVERSVSFCPFFHISVTVQKSTLDRTICVFIPAILLSLRHRDSTFWSLWIYVTLMAILILTN